MDDTSLKSLAESLKVIAILYWGGVAINSYFGPLNNTEGWYETTKAKDI